MMRGSPAVWIWPKIALFNAVTGGLKLTWLIRLNTSHRNWTFCAPAILNVRVNAKSFWRLPGFTMVNGASVLYVPAAGDV